MLAAMERAYKDGMDVLNMSIGSAFEWPQSPTAVASSRLVKKGMVVVASIGNSGANGLYSAGAPGLGEKVIGVASFDNTHVFLPYFEVNGAKIGYVTMTYSAPVPTSGSGVIVDVGLACGVLPAGSLTGKVALAARGTCGFGVKAANAIAAGADAVLVSNNAPGVFNGTLGTPLATPKPVVGISQADGAFLRAQIAPITMTWTDQMASSISPTGGLISSFSSYGLSPDLALKPDIGAPGGNIYSTFPLEQGGYATLSGTSMSSPHVAGTAALLLQAKPHTKAEDVRSMLQNSAIPADWWGYPGVGYVESVHRQGAGMVRIDNAILATTTIEPGKLSLGDSQKGPVTRELEIKNNSKNPVTYDLSFENAMTTGGVITPSFWTSDAMVTFSKPSVTVKGRDDTEIKVTITPASGPDKGQYGGYIIFTPRDGGQVYRVPFAGFVGDYQSIQVLTHPYGLPLLADQYGDDTVTNFTLANGDFPYVFVHLDHQSRIFKLEAFNAVTGKSVGTILQLDYMVRNSTTTSYYAFAWDGTTTGKNNKVYTAPNGQYFIKMSILKALGDSKNPADWETWTSPAFDIARP
jgi:minor extracellular serine protease Vpr